MSRNLRYIFASLLLVLAILACNLPGSQSNQPDLALTITAQALLIPQTGNETATPPPAATGPAAPMASVTAATNCRTGPSTAYDIVISINTGQSAVVVGKDPADNYWIVNSPNGNGTCWLWGQNATVTGNTDGLPQMSPPAPPPPNATKTPKPTKTSTPTTGAPSNIIKPIQVTLIFSAAPAAPTGLSGTRDSCTTGIASDGFTPIWIEGLSLHWTDNANNETGYYVYKNGGQISTIPANSTSFHLSYQYKQNSQNPLYTTFGVAAYNSFGKSAMPTWDVPTCP